MPEALFYCGDKKILVVRSIAQQVNVTVAIANWEGIGRKASARDNRKGLK
jgi:hypothetical protein